MATFCIDIRFRPPLHCLGERQIGGERGGEGGGGESKAVCVLILQRSSRGRTLKPASSSLVANTSMSIYSYDMRGNFIGLSSPVIDLTISSSETTSSVFPTSGNESVLTGGVKQEQPSGGREEGEEGVGVGGEKEERRATGRIGVRGGGGKRESVAGSQKRKSVQDTLKEGQKKQRRKKSHSVIPPGLRKTRKSVAQEVASEQDEGASEDAEEERTVSRHGEEGETATRDVEAVSEEEEKEKGEEEEREGAGDVVLRRRSKDPEMPPMIATREKRRDKSQIESEREKMPLDSNTTGERAAPAGVDKVKTDCLVDSPEKAEDIGRRVTKVKVRHKAVKKRVLISDEVTVIGGCSEGERESGERRRGEKLRKAGGDVEWSSSESKKLSK